MESDASFSLSSRLPSFFFNVSYPCPDAVVFRGCQNDLEHRTINCDPVAYIYTPSDPQPPLRSGLFRRKTYLRKKIELYYLAIFFAIPSIFLLRNLVQNISYFDKGLSQSRFSKQT